MQKWTGNSSKRVVFHPPAFLELLKGRMNPSWPFSALHLFNCLNVAVKHSLCVTVGNIWGFILSGCRGSMRDVQRGFYNPWSAPMYHPFLLETNFHFQHSSFRHDLALTQQCWCHPDWHQPHTGPDPSITHGFIAENYFCVCPGCHRLGREPAGGRLLGLRESVPHHPVGCSLRNFSVTSSSRVEFRSCRVEVLQSPTHSLCVWFYSPLTRALTLGFSWTFPASKAESGGALGNSWLLGLCAFWRISKDTWKAVVKLLCSHSESCVCDESWLGQCVVVMSWRLWVRHSFLAQLWEEKWFFPSFCFLSLDWNLLFIK